MKINIKNKVFNILHKMSEDPKDFICVKKTRKTNKTNKTNNTNNNENFEYKGVEEVNYDYDELIELYNVKEKMESNMKELWDNVIVNYINYCDESQILKNINSKYDYDKFYGFMVKNNEMYKYVISRIYELENF